MNYKILILIFMIYCQGCHHEQPFVQNRNLLGYKSEFLSELDDNRYDSLKVVLKKNHVDIRYINDIIYISHLRETDACGLYIGNIELRSDTIILIYDLASDEVCTSLAIKRVTYLINNAQKKKYKIEIKP